MIKIGDFARLCQVTVPTLRHYDEVGLLKPVTVESPSGYRYYSVSQMPRLNRILALKDLGLSLLQIETVLNGGLSPDELRGMLKLKQAEVQQHLVSEQARLERIAARLKQIEEENCMSEYDVVLKNVPAVLVASCTVTIPTNSQVGDYLGQAYTAVYDHIKDKGAKVVGPHFALWHQAAEVLENEVAETVVPIEKGIAQTDLVKVYEIPATLVASAVHHGPFENFRQMHTTLLQWIEANGYQVAGAYREIYINHHPEDMTNAATEIQYPVSRHY